MELRDQIHVAEANIAYAREQMQRWRDLATNTENPQRRYEAEQQIASYDQTIRDYAHWMAVLTAQLGATDHDE